MNNLKLYIIFTIAILCMVLTSTHLQASYHVWTGAVSSSIVHPGNWASSGSFSASDTFEIVTGTNVPILDQNRSMYALIMTSGTLDLGGYQLTVSSQGQFDGGTIEDGVLSISGESAVFTGTTFDVQLVVTCERIELSGGTFNEVCGFLKTGDANSHGQGGCIFNAPVALAHDGTNGAEWRLAMDTGDEFHDLLFIALGGEGDLSVAEKGSNVFGGDIKLGNIGDGVIIFGYQGGTSELADGKTITIIDTIGYDANNLYLVSFHQVGNTPQRLELTGTARLILHTCTFEGDLEITSPDILCRATEFQGSCTMTKTGPLSNHWYGDNRFLGETTITLEGTPDVNDELMLSATQGNVFEGSVTFESDGRMMLVVENSESEFMSDMTISDDDVSFNGGKAIITGDNAQSLHSSNEIKFDDLTIDKSENHVTLNTPISIKATLEFLSGNIISDTTNTVTFSAGSEATGAHNGSFVSGPVKKVGDTEFEFPVGKGEYFRPLGISAPDEDTDAFVAEYFDYGQTIGESLDSALAFLDPCNFWKLNRLSGESDLNVTLSWGINHCPVQDTTFMKIASWQNDYWNDLGHGEISGDNSAGNMTTEYLVSDFGIFIFAYDINIINISDPDSYLTGYGFVKNKGQLMGTDTLTHSEVLYYGKAGNTALFLQDSTFSYVFASYSVQPSHSLDTTLNYITVDSIFRVDMKLFNHNSIYEIEPNDTCQGYRNFLLGDLDSAITRAMSFQEIRYSNIFNGIDLSFYNGDEFRFMINGNSEPGSIKYYYQGADSVIIDEGNVLKLFTTFGEKQYTAIANQFIDNRWIQVPASFIQTDSLISFSLGSFDENEPILISVSLPNYTLPLPNPHTRLKWSTYYGGGSNLGDVLNDVVLDEDDFIYCIGSTYATNYPTNFGSVQVNNLGDYEATVVKFRPDRSIDFCTYIGGSDFDAGIGIAINGNKDIGLTGSTNSTDFHPCSPSCGGYSQSLSGDEDAFIVILTADGTDLLMSTLFGGSGIDGGSQIAFDGSNNIIVAGNSMGQISIPSPNQGFYQQHNGSNDCFVAKFDDTNELIWATHIGGEEQDIIQDIKLDNLGNLFIVGYTGSLSTSDLGSPIDVNTSSDFPVGIPIGGSPHLQTNFFGDFSNGFICKFNSNNILVWSTLFGGANQDWIYGIDFSPLNNDIVIVGETESETSDGFPIYNMIGSNVNDDELDGLYDGFIARFNSGYELKWCTYYGGINTVTGSGHESLNHVAFNESGQFYIVGSTKSNNLNLISSHGYFDNQLGIGNSTSSLYHDMIILKFSSSYVNTYASYFGGESHEIIQGIAFQGLNFNSRYDLIMVGRTFSANVQLPGVNQEFPLTNFIGSTGSPYYEPFLNITSNESSAFISNLYNISTPFRNSLTVGNQIFHLRIPEISIFPNPFNNNFTIKSSIGNITKFILSDIVGKVILLRETNSAILKIEGIDQLTPGVYIAEGWINGNSHKVKIVKQ